MAQNKSKPPATGGAKGQGKGASAETVKKKKKVGPVTFFRQVRAEGAKVTWTSRSETVAATIMVLVMTVIVSIFLLTVDQIVGWGVRLVSGV